MTTTDPYRFDGTALDGTAARPDPARPGVTLEGAARTVLWLVLVLSTVGNMAASLGGASTQVHLAFGAVTALCVTVLVTRHLRGRR